jgi:hypothetical protein
MDGGAKRSSTIWGPSVRTTRHSGSQQHGAAMPHLVILLRWYSQFVIAVWAISGPGNSNSSMLFKETMLTDRKETRQTMASIVYDVPWVAV